LKGPDHFEDLKYVWTNIKTEFKETGLRLWTGFTQLTNSTNDNLLTKRQRICQFQKYG